MKKTFRYILNWIYINLALIGLVLHLDTPLLGFDTSLVAMWLYIMLAISLTLEVSYILFKRWIANRDFKRTMKDREK